LKILVINSGSSSLKYTLFEMDNESILFSGTIDRIGLENTTHSFRAGSGEAEVMEMQIADQGAALDVVLATLTAGPLASLDELSAVAHRVGHGGRYKDAVRITPEVVAEIRKMTPMIPLHHPAMIREIEECQARMPNAIHCAVFDTSFHRTIPDEAAIYGLPYRYFEKGYRRTGFHGNSHAYVSAKAAEFLGRRMEDLKIISCHLGNGASLCAIARGGSIDTSLGMTAVEGLMMGTRSGDVDPGLLPVIMKEDALSPEQMTDMLFKESGLLGISGVSRDMREIEEAASRGHARAALALNAFCYKVKRYIGAMLMALGGCDVLIFTGGIGRNSATVRAKSLEGAAGLGFLMNEGKNHTVSTTAENPVGDISAASSTVRILVVRTFEELMMARQCAAVAEQDES
jgi:acetate kinase